MTAVIPELIPRGYFITAIAEQIQRAWLARLDAAECWALVHHHHPDASQADVIEALRLWGWARKRRDGDHHDRRVVQ